MLYGIRRRPERLDRHPGVRAELNALGFSWEVPKKGPRGPRKRKLLAASSVGGAVDGDVNGAVTSYRHGDGSGEVACRQAGESQHGVVKVERQSLRPPSGRVVPAAADGGEDGCKGVGLPQELVAKVTQATLIGVDEAGTIAAAAPPPDDDGVGVGVTLCRPRRNSSSSSGGAGRSPAKTDAESIGENALAAGTSCRSQSREMTEELLAPAAR